MTSPINEIHKKPDRMSSTRSSSLPENMLNIRSSSLPRDLSDTQSTPIPTNLPNITDSTPLPNKRSASLPSLKSFTTNERGKNDGIEKISRRYATYDLNWNNTDDHIDLENSIQVVNSTLSDPIIIPSSTSLIQEDLSPTSPPIISSPISPISYNDYNYFDNYFDFDNEEKYSFPGGITVTTVKVVQVNNRSSIERTSRIPLPKNKFLYKNESNNTYNILKKQMTIKRQKKSTTDNNISKQTIKERRKTKIYNNIAQNDVAQLRMINNINERKFNGVVRRTSSRRRIGVQYRKSHKKRQIQSQERMVPAPTSNPFYTNDPTDMEGDDVILSPTTKGFPWLPVTNGPPKLLHASLVPLSQFIKKVETTSPVDVPRSKSKRKSVESISAPKPKRPSQLFRENLLEQSVAMSLNEAIMGRNVFASQVTRRSSLNAKIPRRRYSRKGSNAKLEDRDARKERRRKEKKEKNIEKKSTKEEVNDNIEQDQMNSMVISKILETDELKKKVEEQLRKKAILQHPLPPPRLTQPVTEFRREPTAQRQGSKSPPLISTLPDKRSIEPEPSSYDEPLPFPTHLTRRHMSMYKQPIHHPFATHITSSTVF